MMRGSNYIPCILILLLAFAMPASAVEHPGVLPRDADCSSCHSDKSTGKSVHSAMATSCAVCHLTRTQGDMTSVSLAMPKAQICFACHEKSVELQRHSPVVKGACLNCHDAHSSDRRMLLRAATDTILPPHCGVFRGGTFWFRRKKLSGS